jgi:hypothetical protein
MVSSTRWAAIVLVLATGCIYKPLALSPDTCLTDCKSLSTEPEPPHGDGSDPADGAPATDGGAGGEASSADPSPADHGSASDELLADFDPVNPCLVPDSFEPNDTVSHAKTIPYGVYNWVTVAATLPPGDVDWYSYEGYVAEVLSWDVVLSWPTATDVQLSITSEGTAGTTWSCGTYTSDGVNNAVSCCLLNTTGIVRVKVAAPQMAPASCYELKALGSSAQCM